MATDSEPLITPEMVRQAYEDLGVGMIHGQWKRCDDHGSLQLCPLAVLFCKVTGKSPYGSNRNALSIGAVDYWGPLYVTGFTAAVDAYPPAPDIPPNTIEASMLRGWHDGLAVRRALFDVAIGDTNG